jgi:hypothetical protein
VGGQLLGNQRIFDCLDGKLANLHS